MSTTEQMDGDRTTGKEKRMVVQNQFLLVDVFFDVHPNKNSVGELSGHGWLLGLKHKYLFFYVKSAKESFHSHFTMRPYVFQFS